jgi:hypothetical protein
MVPPAPPAPPAPALPALPAPPEPPPAAAPALPPAPLEEPPRPPPEPAVASGAPPEPLMLVGAPLAPADVLPPLSVLPPGVLLLLEQPLSALQMRTNTVDPRSALLAMVRAKQTLRRNRSPLIGPEIPLFHQARTNTRARLVAQCRTTLAVLGRRSSSGQKASARASSFKCGFFAT